MPDLGRYAAEVGAAYGISGVLLLGVVGLTLWRSGRVKRALDRAEARKHG